MSNNKKKKQASVSSDRNAHPNSDLSDLEREHDLLMAEISNLVTNDLSNTTDIKSFVEDTSSTKEKNNEGKIISFTILEYKCVLASVSAY